jgi:uncharacterized protein YcaQ
VLHAAGKRRYGYFTLPILWGEQLAGRLDAKAERKAGVLVLRGLWLEDGFMCDGFAENGRLATRHGAADDEFTSALAAKLRAFALFNGCASVRITCRKPAKLVHELKRLLA